MPYWIIVNGTKIARSFNREVDAWAWIDKELHNWDVIGGVVPKYELYYGNIKVKRPKYVNTIINELNGRFISKKGG